MFQMNSASTTSNRAQAQGLVEYGLIISLVAIVAIAGLLVLGPAVASMFSSLSAYLG
jgi:pilus assembly protein Flp/PilA